MTTRQAFLDHHYSATNRHMNVDNAAAMIADLLRAFPDETLVAGRRLRRDEAAALNAAIVRAKDIRAGMNNAREREILGR